MYPENEQAVLKARDIAGCGISYGSDQKLPQGLIRDAIEKAQGVCNLLESCNGTLDEALSRINGGVPVSVANGREQASSVPSGDIGMLMATLDRLYGLASTNSNLASATARL